MNHNERAVDGVSRVLSIFSTAEFYSPVHTSIPPHRDRNCCNPRYQIVTHSTMDSKKEVRKEKVDLSLLEEDDELEEFPVQGKSYRCLADSWSLIYLSSIRMARTT